MSQLASPIVKAGKMMWNEIVKANWMRDNKRASTSIARSSLGFPVCRAARAGATGFSDRPQAGAQPRQRNHRTPGGRPGRAAPRLKANPAPPGGGVKPPVLDLVPLLGPVAALAD